MGYLFVVCTSAKSLNFAKPIKAFLKEMLHLIVILIKLKELLIQGINDK